MPKLQIKKTDLIDALTSNFEMMGGGWYLDTETGEVLLVTDDINDDDDLAADIEDNPRYLAIESIPSHESFRIMEDFVATLDDPAVVRKLEHALEVRKPFRHFKDALCEFPPVREAWFKFEAAAHVRIAEEWCDANGIEVEWVGG